MSSSLIVLLDSVHPVTSLVDLLEAIPDFYVTIGAFYNLNLPAAGSNHELCRIIPPGRTCDLG